MPPRACTPAWGAGTWGAGTWGAWGVPVARNRSGAAGAAGRSEGNAAVRVVAAAGMSEGSAAAVVAGPVSSVRPPIIQEYIREILTGGAGGSHSSSTGSGSSLWSTGGGRGAAGGGGGVATAIGVVGLKEGAAAGGCWKDAARLRASSSSACFFASA